VNTSLFPRSSPSAPTVLDPEPDGPADRIAARLDGHPFLDSAAVLILGYVLISLVMLALGLLLVHGRPTSPTPKASSAWRSSYRSSSLRAATGARWSF